MIFEVEIDIEFDRGVSRMFQRIKLIGVVLVGELIDHQVVVDVDVRAHDVC